MAFKGFNSILFDFDSLLDKEITMLEFLRRTYKPDDLVWLSPDLWKDKIQNMEFRRMHGRESLFKSYVMADDYREKYKNIIEGFFTDEPIEKDMLQYAHLTALIHLVTAYLKTGNGTIQTTIRVSNKLEQDFVRSKISENIPIIVSQSRDVDMSKYGRLIIGDWRTGLKYRYGEPKSILITNFRENFMDDDINILSPELVINLGDIHDIQVISAYRMDLNPQG